MKYKNAREILPDKLLRELQQYISGETLYIPRAEDADRKGWGQRSGARSYYRERNGKIRERFAAGETVEALADAFGLSEETIRKIVYED